MIKKYADVLLAALLALATGLFVPFSPALLWESINWNLLGILFCLMTITAEIGKWGIPRALCLHFLTEKSRCGSWPVSLPVPASFRPWS